MSSIEGRFEYDLSVIAEKLSDQFQEVESLSLFGSRRWKTQSERSDIDVLVEANDYLRPERVRDFSDSLAPALDCFIFWGDRAISCVNGSYLVAGSVVELKQRLNALDFWRKGEGFIESDVARQTILVRTDVTFIKSVFNPWYSTVNPADHFIDESLVGSTRSYVERLVKQINLCYSSGSYDGAAILVRKLLETLIVELFIAKGKTSEIQSSDSTFFALERLIGKISSGIAFTPSRNLNTAMSQIKELGDLAAHNRTFSATQSDLISLRFKIGIMIRELVFEIRNS